MTNPSPTAFADDFAAALADNDRMYRERHRDFFDLVAKWAKTPAWRWPDEKTGRVIRRQGDPDWPHSWRPAQITMPRYDDDTVRYVSEAARDVLSPAPRPAGVRPNYRAAPKPRTRSVPVPPPRQSSGLPPLTLPLVMLALALSVPEARLSPDARSFAEDAVANLGLVAGVIALMHHQRRR